MRLILVRHGETEWVRTHRYQGASDVPLNRLGKQQARAAARALKGERPFAIFASELGRVKETARIIASVCSKKFQIDGRLNEVSFGQWEGYSFDEVKAKYPKDVRDWYLGRWSSQ